MCDSRAVCGDLSRVVIVPYVRDLSSATRAFRAREVTLDYIATMHTVCVHVCVIGRLKFIDQ